MNLGYCCINLSLKSLGIQTNRRIKKETFQKNGLNLISDIVIKNLNDLLTILKWNKENNIYVYRMSSDLFPWMSEYSFEQLPNFEKEILPILHKIGNFALENKIRLSFHPGQYSVLASPNENVLKNSIEDLNKHSKIMDLMGLPKNNDFPINIHIGGTYGDKESSAIRFCQNFEKLEESTKRRLVVENDDKESQFTSYDLYYKIYKKIGIPITFDHFHHSLHNNGISTYEAAHMCAETWKNSIPLQHYSSSKFLNEDSKSNKRAHADYIYEKIETYGLLCDIEIEAKAKDLALLKYREQYK